jgi:hypothetical protein
MARCTEFVAMSMRVLLVPLLVALIVVPALHLATPLGLSVYHHGVKHRVSPGGGRTGLLPDDATAALPPALADAGPIGPGEHHGASPLFADRPFVPPRV